MAKWIIVLLLSSCAMAQDIKCEAEYTLHYKTSFTTPNGHAMKLDVTAQTLSAYYGRWYSSVVEQADDIRTSIDAAMKDKP